ncbi:hypothetical protein LINJ_03_0340 [Leishmania infantum JPCM5]|uniref:Uncharacterized protein n=2 Tax=Leishmania infantum TaxID=5671 RepID=A4HRU6_LEIIN|nr:hypothetical protein LINJ_03_0340 [Leishmania infantum JPCM5]CAC9439052.1 hypothetical_protein_-_conserved [Leishmania infantum]CAM60009.2 hypothetical protein LINJ_03_0340 [Leishmania infantum JPCM5]SUZ38730.1 hypothetical_protein_-_conserved [Leishmania infantum]|eukprot:XP_001462788.2 hypothetical protein LINJ_03_0340 [Leishmania infantum JPCM5]
MVIHVSVVRNGTQESCGAAVGTDDSVGGSGYRNSSMTISGGGDALEDVSVPYRLPAPLSPPTMVEDENRHENSNRPECCNERTGSSTDAAESGVEAVQSSKREGSPSTTTSTALSPSVVRVRPGANTTSGVPSNHTLGKGCVTIPCAVRARSPSGAAASPSAAHRFGVTPPSLFTPEPMPVSVRERTASPPSSTSTAEAGQRLGSIDSGTISAASNSRRPEPLCKEALYDAQQLTASSDSVPASGSQHAPATALAPQDTEPHPIPVNATASLSCGLHSCSLYEPALGPDVATSTAVGSAAMPPSEAATAKQNSTSAASAPFRVSEQAPRPDACASPLHGWASSVSSASTRVSGSARFREEPRPASPVTMVPLLTATPPFASAAIAVTSAEPPRSLGALPLSSASSSSPSPPPAVPSPSSSAPTLVFASPTHPRCPQAPSPAPSTPPQQQQQQQQQMPSPARMTSLVHVSEGEEVCEDLGKGLLSSHGNLHTPLGGPEKGNAGFSTALCVSLLSGCGGGNGGLSPIGSLEAAGRTARPNTPILQPSAGPQSRPQLLEPSFLTAGTPLAQPIGRSLVALPPILSTGAAANSTSSLSLLLPPSVMSISFLSGSGHTNSGGVAGGGGGGTGVGGAGGFRSPLAFRSPFTSVLTPQAHHHEPHHSQHSDAVSPHPCLFHRHASVRPTTPLQQSPALQHGFSLPPSFYQQQQKQRPPDPSPPRTSMMSIASSSSLYSRSSPSPLALGDPDPAPGSGPLPASSSTFMQGGGVAVATAMSQVSAHHTAGGSPAAARRAPRVHSPLLLPPSAAMPSFTPPPFVTVPLSGISSPGGEGRTRQSSLAFLSSTPGLPSTPCPAPGQAASSLTSAPTISAVAAHKEADRGDAWSANAAGSGAIALRDGSQSRDQQQHHAHHRLHTVSHLSARGVAAQPVVCPQAWRVLEVSGGSSCSVDNSGDCAAEWCSGDGQQRLNIASPADSVTARQPHEREVPHGVVEALRSPDMSREGDDSEATTHLGNNETNDAGNGDGDYLEEDVVASEDEREASLPMYRCHGSRNSVAIRDTTPAAPPARPPRAVSLHSRSGDSAYLPEHITEAAEEMLAVERGFSASSILAPTLPRTPGRASSSSATAATVTHERHFWVSSFASLSHGRQSAAPAAAVAAPSCRAPPTACTPAPSPFSVSPGCRWARGSGAAARLTERLSVSSAPFTSPMSPSYRKTSGRAVNSRSNSCLGGRCRESPMRRGARSRRASSVTIIGVAEDESVPISVRGSTSPRPGSTAAGAARRRAASVSTRSAHVQATPTSPAAVSPLAELLLSPPSRGTGSGAHYRLNSSCNGDMPTPDMAAAAAAAVQRLHRKRPNPIPPLSTVPTSSPKASAATESHTGAGEAEGNASALAEATPQQQRRERDVIKAAVAATTETEELSDPLPQRRSNESSRSLHRTPSSVARAVAVALRRPWLSEDPAGGGVPLHNPFPCIPSLLMSSKRPSWTAAVDPTTVADPGEPNAKPSRCMQEGEAAEAGAAAVPQLRTSVVSTEVSVVDGAAADGTPEVLPRQRAELEQPPSPEQQQARPGGCFKHPSSSPNLGVALTSASTAVLAAPQPPSDGKAAVSATTPASRRRYHRVGTSPPPPPIPLAASMIRTAMTGVSWLSSKSEK